MYHAFFEFIKSNNKNKKQMENPASNDYRFDLFFFNLVKSGHFRLLYSNLIFRFIGGNLS